MFKKKGYGRKMMDKRYGREKERNDGYLNREKKKYGRKRMIEKKKEMH